MKKLFLLLSLLYLSIICIACTKPTDTDSEKEKDVCVRDPQNPICLPPEDPFM